MSKFTPLLIIALLLFSTLTHASRPLPDSDTPSLVNTEHEKSIEAENIEVADESCEGIGEEECLTRRTLEAHIDYIYTQNKKP
ncbi:Phytosulfokine [Dillenia turbinata]|uniref:Phytosulfokine n=1 Tax=Dillenia turbinata TaxID=194707 RepID=A0AAN8V4F8_9MAGN